MSSRLLVPMLLILVPSSAHSEWTWRYPQPQGHTLNDIVFLTNTTAIAVGETGTVLVTRDVGQSWDVSYQVAGIESELLAIDRLDAMSAVAVGWDGVVVRTFDGGATWVPISSGVTDRLLDVSFSDALNGIAVGGPTVLRTADGGMTWLSGTVSASLNAVDMVTASVAIAAGEFSKVLRTTDGGQTWTPVPYPAPPEYNASITAVDFIDPLRGCVGNATSVTDFGGILYSGISSTVDGGLTWSHVYPFPDPPYRIDATYTPSEILYATNGTSLVAYSMACCIFTSSDIWPWGEIVSIGANNAVTHRQVTQSANGIARNEDGVALIVGEDGLIMKRMPDGSVVQLGGVQHYHHIGGGNLSFFDPSTGIVASADDYLNPSGFLGVETSFVRTNNGGLTWQTSRVPNVQCASLVHVSSTEVYAAGTDTGERGTILRSMDGGASWSVIFSSTSIRGIGPIAASSGHVVAMGNGGWALLIDNGTVTPVSTGASGSIPTDVAFADASVILAVRVSGLSNLRSTDGGHTWTLVPRPTQRVVRFDFATPSTAFGVTSAGILRSDDVGSTWVPVPSGVYSDLRDIAFVDADHGIAVGDEGLVIATADGGATWMPLDPPTQRDFRSVALFSDGRAFVSANQQLLLEFFQQTVPTLISTFDIEARPFAAALHWDVREDANLSEFMIRRSTGSNDKTIATQLPRTARAYRDDSVVPGQTYRYQLVAVDTDGAVTMSAPISTTIPAAVLELSQNHPNPFNPSTMISFVVPAKEWVRLAVYDATGRRMATLVDGIRDAGAHSVEWNGSGAASGVYFARLESGKDVVSRKLVLLK